MSKEMKKNDIQEDNDSDELGDLQQDNSFQKNNELFDLKSQINFLKIQKQKLSLEHQTALKTQQTKNQKLTNELNQKKRQISRLENENDELRQTIDSHRKQIESVNRKTADFHHSIEGNNSLGDPSDLINELLEKDKQIEKLKKKLSDSANLKQSVGSKSSKKWTQNQQKLQKQIKILNQTIDDLKRKQIAYKRQYQQMIQSKQNIIKKLSNQSDQISKKNIQSRDKIITELRKELQDNINIITTQKIQIQKLQVKNNQLDNQIVQKTHQSRLEYKKLTQSFETQKNNIVKEMSQKIKKQIRQKDNKINELQNNNTQYSQQILSLNQIISKLKSQVSSSQQFNQYLQSNNKQYQQSKQKLQKMLFEKEKEIAEINNNHFKQLSSLKNSNFIGQKQLEQKCEQLSQQLSKKAYIITRLQKQLINKQKKEEGIIETAENYLKIQIQQLKTDNTTLQSQLSLLQSKYNAKTEELIKIQSNIISQYNKRMIQLQQQLRKERGSKNKQIVQIVQQRQQQKNKLSSQYKKLQMICQLLEIQKQQKNNQIIKLTQIKLQLENDNKQNIQKINLLQNKMKEKTQDYSTLEVIHDELKDKYRKGIINLQQNIEMMQNKIRQEKIKNQKRKQINTQIQSNLVKQNQDHKNTIKLLQSKLQSINKIHNKSVQQNKQIISQLNKQIKQLNKQKQQINKYYNNLKFNLQNQFDIQKNNLINYIQQLQSNLKINNSKLSILNNRQSIIGHDFQKLAKQNQTIKSQYSLALQQINHLLQQCKHLENINKDHIFKQQSIRDKNQFLSQKYTHAIEENNKISHELNSAYDQIQKLNIVLMNKEGELSKSRTHIPLPQPQSQQSQIQTYQSSHYPSVTTYLVKETPIVNSQTSLHHYTYSNGNLQGELDYPYYQAPKIVRLNE